MAWMIEAESCSWFRAAALAGGAMGRGAGVPMGVGRRYMESMVGRRAAPKGVERKSVGRSVLKKLSGDATLESRTYL